MIRQWEGGICYRMWFFLLMLSSSIKKLLPSCEGLGLPAGWQGCVLRSYLDIRSSLPAGRQAWSEFEIQKIFQKSQINILQSLPRRQAGPIKKAAFIITSAQRNGPKNVSGLEEYFKNLKSSIFSSILFFGVLDLCNTQIMFVIAQ